MLSASFPPLSEPRNETGSQSPKEDTMNRFRVVAVLAGTVLCLTAGRIAAQTDAPHDEAMSAGHAMNIRFQDLKWEKMQPELGDKSAEITILRVDPTTKATHLMIRVPKNFHVPKHWHTANETHTVVKGSFIMECEGERETLGQGSWNFVPCKRSEERRVGMECRPARGT